LAGPMFGYGDLMGGFFNFLTTIATIGRGRPFDTFLALTTHYSTKSMKTLEELTPGGCRWPVADPLYLFFFSREGRSVALEFAHASFHSGLRLLVRLAQ
jgi:hypothetical protein